MGGDPESRQQHLTVTREEKPSTALWYFLFCCRRRNGSQDSNNEAWRKMKPTSSAHLRHLPRATLRTSPALHSSDAHRSTCRIQDTLHDMTCPAVDTPPTTNNIPESHPRRALAAPSASSHWTIDRSSLSPALCPLARGLLRLLYTYVACSQCGE